MRITVILIAFAPLFLGRCTGETGVRLSGGNYVLTSSFKLPPLQQLTVCTWVKLANLPAGRSADQQHILSYYEPDQPALFSLSLRPPGFVHNNRGEIIARLNNNLFTATLFDTEFNSYYERWKSFCFSWDLTHTGIKIFVDGQQLKHQGTAHYFRRAHIGGGWPLVIGQYIYSYTPQSATPNTGFDGTVGTVKIWNSVSNSVSIKERMECRSVATVYSIRRSDLSPFSSRGLHTTLVEVSNVCSLIACPNPDSQIVLPQTDLYSKPIISTYGIPREGSVVFYRCKPGHTLYPATSTRRTCLKDVDQHLEWSGGKPYCSGNSANQNVVNSVGNLGAIPLWNNPVQTGLAAGAEVGKTANSKEKGQGVSSVSINNLTSAAGDNSSLFYVPAKEEGEPPLTAILVPIFLFLLLVACIVVGVVLYRRGKLRDCFSKCHLKNTSKEEAGEEAESSSVGHTIRPTPRSRDFTEAPTKPPRIWNRLSAQFNALFSLPEADPDNLGGTRATNRGPKLPPRKPKPIPRVGLRSDGQPQPENTLQETAAHGGAREVSDDVIYGNRGVAFGRSGGKGGTSLSYGVSSN